MSFARKLMRLIEDPPPSHIFEISESGIAYAVRLPTLKTGFEPFPEPMVSVSPLHDNVTAPDALEEFVASRFGGQAGRKRPAVLILPDFCGRVAVLDFDSFPADPAEQAELVRFRVKKSVPYDLDSAAVAFAPQGGRGKQQEVVVALVAMEVVSRYEAPFRAAGFHPGFVTTSALASLALAPRTGVAIMARLHGRLMTVSVTDRGAVKLVRSVELPELNEEEASAVLFPTMAFIEDELKSRPDVVRHCGFEPWSGTLLDLLGREFGVATEPLSTPMGLAKPYNCGLLGQLAAGEAM
ncbi:MAG: hypothetical protein FJW40_08540 [Acidobacteria bacterium]|nr:hypothetical protein [Acidobacteriota bacterium]